MDEIGAAPHRRYNPLTGEWVLNSPSRLTRPWQGEKSAAAAPARAHYDPECYLCPGNTRANGERNPRYEHTFAFENDYAALKPDTPREAFDQDGLFAARGEPGRCRVLCFSPRHDLDVATMPHADVRRVVNAWAAECAQLAAEPGITAITVFENRGAMMGASNPHPHSQIWAEAGVPDELLKERRGFERYAAAHGGCLLCAYAQRETACAERVVYADENVCALVPFWAVWPFETMIVARRHAVDLAGADDALRDALATAMQEIASRYDRLFGVPFPYTMGWHQRDHLHAHYYPPLLRSATVRKYMVGYEMLAGPQRDISPEEAAERLRRA